MYTYISSDKGGTLWERNNRYTRFTKVFAWVSLVQRFHKQKKHRYTLKGPEYLCIEVKHNNYHSYQTYIRHSCGLQKYLKPFYRLYTQQLHSTICSTTIKCRIKPQTLFHFLINRVHGNEILLLLLGQTVGNENSSLCQLVPGSLVG